MPQDERIDFQSLFEQFLYRLDVEITPFPPVVCPNGHRQDRELVVKRQREGTKFVFCNECGEKTDLPAMGIGDQPSSGFGASDWLMREESIARLRNLYETCLVRIKGYRRAWSPPRCHITHVSEQKEFAKRLARDLADAGIFIIDDPQNVKPDDTIIMIDSPAFKTAWENNQMGSEASLVRSRLETGKQSGLISVNQSEPIFEHTLEQCLSTSFYDPTHYVINLFDLVLRLYTIPLNHSGFLPLRQSLHQQWEQTLAPEVAAERTASDIKSNAPTQQEIFISYAWGGESEKLIDKINQEFLNRGVVITPDRRDLGYKSSINEFMERLDRGRCVVVVIGDKYLKSKNSMFELIQITNHKQSKDRVFAVVLSDADIYSAVGRIKYLEYWETKRQELDKAIKEISPQNLQGIREEIDLFDEIRDVIGTLTDLLRDLNTLTPDMHRDSDFQALFNAVMAKLEE